MKTLDLSQYKKNKPHFLYEYSSAFYQKRIQDDKGTKYFINIVEYQDTPGDLFTAHSQFTFNERSINIETVGWTNDPEEKHRPYPTIEEIETFFEKMWIAYGSEYYESI